MPCAVPAIPLLSSTHTTLSKYMYSDSTHWTASTHSTRLVPVLSLLPSRITIPYHHLISSSRIIISSSHIIIPYHHLISSSRIIISYYHPVSSSHIIISYHHCISSSHIIIPYHHPVSSSHIIISYPVSYTHLTLPTSDLV